MYIHLFYFIDDGKWLKWQMFIQKPYLCIYKIYKSPIFCFFSLFLSAIQTQKNSVSWAANSNSIKSFFYSFCALHCFFFFLILFLLFCTYFFWTNKFSIVLVELWQQTLLRPLIFVRSSHSNLFHSLFLHPFIYLSLGDGKHQLLHIEKLFIFFFFFISVKTFLILNFFFFFLWRVLGCWCYFIWLFVISFLDVMFCKLFRKMLLKLWNYVIIINMEIVVF